MKIAVLPGDGIGKEIVAEAIQVLGRLGLKFEFEEAPVGGAGFEASGHPLPERTLALARQADAILFGAVGDPRYDALPSANRCRGMFLNSSASSVQSPLRCRSTSSLTS